MMGKIYFFTGFVDFLRLMPLKKQPKCCNSPIFRVFLEKLLFCP